MFSINKLQARVIVATFTTGMVGGLFAGAIVGAIGASAFGILYGTLATLLHVGAWGIVPVACYFALCGAVSGAMVGGFAKVLDIDANPRSADRARVSGSRRIPTELPTMRHPEAGERITTINSMPLTIGSTSMRKTPLAPKIGAAIRGGLVGAMCGALLAALGSVVSSSPLGIGATIVLTSVLGAWLGRLTGTIIGAGCGLLLAALGSILGGSVFGVIATIMGCMLLAGWLGWVFE